MPRSISAEILRHQRCIPSYLWEYYLEWSQASHLLATGKGLSEADMRAHDWTLPAWLRHVVRFIGFDGDVFNGGIAQFFYNHTPREVIDTLDALRATGLDESAAVLERAIDHCRNNFEWPAESDERWLDGPSGDEADIVELDDIRCNETSSERDFARLDSFLRARLGDFIP
jgi:hypothetical protein